MIIGIDARVLEKKISGVGRYLLEIIKLLSLRHTEIRFKLFSVGALYKSFGDDLITDNVESVISGHKIMFPKLYSPFWLNFILPGLIKKNKIDIYFSPNNLLPFNRLDCKSVITIHDVFHMIDKNYHPFFYRYYMNLALPHSIKRSDQIIAISHTTKNDILKFFNVDARKINVIYPLPDTKFHPSKKKLDKRIINKYNLPEEYVLYVGVIENRKNIIGILNIADIVFSKFPHLRFVLVGRDGHGFSSIIREIKKRKNVTYLNYINSIDLASIYNLAKIFLFPSYYEGFGYPPLEAMQCGVPVVCSNIPALREVVNDGGYLTNPENYRGFANEIIKLLSDSRYYSEMKIKSLNRAKIFTGEVSLEKYQKIFNII